MRVYLKDINAEPKEYFGKMSPEEIGLTKDDYIHFIAPVGIRACVYRADDAVISETQVRGRFQSVCSRTLEPVERDWQEEFTLHFPVDIKTEFIDLDEDVRQEIILHLPMIVLSEAEENKDKKKKDSAPDMRLEEKQQPETYQPFSKLKWKNNK